MEQNRIQLVAQISKKTARIMTILRHVGNPPEYRIAVSSVENGFPLTLVISQQTKPSSEVRCNTLFKVT